ncbi:MAG: S8 family serine peptidase [Anaerolineae bacterium]|nr:MAG: S8 family serine peptidase [Anaerolineae bacterium]
MPPIKRCTTTLRLFYIAVLLAGLLPWTGSVRAEPPQPTATPTRAPFAYGVSFLVPDGQVGTTYRGIPEGTQAPAAADPSTLIAEALTHINDARQTAGLSRLLASQALAGAAGEHAADLLSSGAFEHRGSDGRWPADRAAQHGYPATYLGQNLAVGYATAGETVNAWLANDGSRANLLDPRFTHAGLAFAHNGPWHNYWVLVLAEAQSVSFYISGRISTTHGTPTANVTVTISGTGVLSTTYSDALGIYAQTDLITGTYVVVPSQQGISFTPISRTVAVGPGDADDVDFTREDFQVYLPFTAKEYAGPMLLPDDPSFNSQWGLHNVGQVGGTVDADIDAPHAWAYHTGAPSVIVAIVDSGVDMDHPEFNGRLKAGWDYVNDDSDPDDDNGHGTHVAGIAAATGNNGVGVAGVAWQVQIMPVKVLDSDGSGWYSDMISGINYAVTHGAKVINMSLGGTSPSQAMQDAVNNAYQSGVLVVAAVGNCGDWNYIANGCSYQDQPLYPAAGDNALAVASTTRWDAQSSFSNQGAYVDIAAPGSAIYSTYMGSSYDSMSGTSMATPFVAGLAGLVYSRYPDYSPDQVAQAIVHNADDLGTSDRDDQFGCGRINAYRSLAHGALSSDCAGWSGLSGEDVQGRLAPPLDAEFRRGVLLVKFHEDVSVDGRVRTLGAHGLTVVDLIEELGIHLVAVPEGRELALATTLGDDPAVAYAELDYKIYALPLWPHGRTASQP